MDSPSAGASDVPVPRNVNSQFASKCVGRVVGLWRYPVKSMAAEALESVTVSWHGFAGDRRWAFIKNAAAQNGFPWFTIRERGGMGHYLPVFTEPSDPERSPIVVQTPSGQMFDIADPKLGADLCPGGARAIKQNRGIFDTFPLSLITTQTLVGLADLVSAPLDVRRFRPNFLLDITGAEPFVEDTWMGHVLRIGELRMRIDKRDGRCAVITVDPVSTKRTQKILRTVAKERQGCLGVYGTTVEPGNVMLNDNVILESMA